MFFFEVTVLSVVGTIMASKDVHISIRGIHEHVTLYGKRKVVAVIKNF